MKEGYIPKEERKKILLLSDDMRFQSGIATISREMTIGTAHHYNWVQLGGSIQHPEFGKCLNLSEEVNKVVGIPDSSVFIYPVHGYGDPNFLRQIIEIERPDAIMIFTDPRYWTWLFQMENEIREKHMLIYLNIWDDEMEPLYNFSAYASCDLLMNISKQTHNLVKKVLDWGEHEYIEIN